MYYWLSLSSHCSLLWICQACYFHRCFRAWEPLIQMLCCFDTVPVLDGKLLLFGTLSFMHLTVLDYMVW